MRNTNYIGRLVMLPIILLVIPFGGPVALLTGDFEYLEYMAKYVYLASEPLWILPVTLVKGTWGYFTMDLFPVDEAAYGEKVSAVLAAARTRQSEAQGRYSRAVPPTPRSREERLAERLAEARKQAADAARHSQLRRISRGIRKAMDRLEAPATRVRMLGTRIDEASEEAVRRIRSGDLRSSTRDELLFGALGVTSAALGPVAGEVVKHGGKMVAGTLDTERELAVLEMSRLEGRAAKLKALHHILASTRALPPDERGRAIRETLAMAAPLLTRARADEGMTAWSFLGKANGRRENWNVVAPELRKRVQKYGLGMIAGVGINQGAQALPVVRNMPDLDAVVRERAGARAFFQAVGKETGKEVAGAVADRGISPAVDWVDRIVDKVKEKNQ